MEDKKDIFTGEGKPNFKEGLGEELRKRGRPKNESKTKGVGFRLEESLYNYYDELAQENAGVSIHTFIKDNLDLIFKEKIENKRRNIMYMPDEKILEKIKIVLREQDIKTINKILSDDLTDYIIKSNSLILFNEILENLEISENDKKEKFQKFFYVYSRNFHTEEILTEELIEIAKQILKKPIKNSNSNNEKIFQIIKEL